jgi:hypothetical protein
MQAKCSKTWKGRRRPWTTTRKREKVLAALLKLKK